MLSDRDTWLQVAALGAQVKVERKRRGLTVQQLSRLAGVSFGIISQLERGKGNPTFETLHRLADALEVPLPTLLSRLDGDDAVVRADQRHRLTDRGAEVAPVRELLTPRTQSNLQAIRTTLPAGFTNEGRPFRHLGTEWLVVASGHLLVVHGERRVELATGDAMTYACSVPHWWANLHDGETVVVGAVTPLET